MYKVPINQDLYDLTEVKGVINLQPHPLLQLAIRDDATGLV